MKIINIIDDASPVNTGIWNAAICTAESLKKIYNVDSELWYPELKDDLSIPFCNSVPLISTYFRNIKKLIIERSISPENSIIVTHGCWQYPTKWGKKFKSLGYKWIYVPHGMLEPWSLEQKKWLKLFYFSLSEKPKAMKADYVRAVGSPEKKNLDKIFNKVALIPNGVPIPEKEIIYSKRKNPFQFVFMARLHYKKGIGTLVEAWNCSQANNNPNYKLIIAGPDHGELDKILPFIHKSNNIEYVGMVKGTQKHHLLSMSHFYVLPSFSEGFPTTVVEALSYGMIPLITRGCNFPEAVENKNAIEITTEKKDLIDKLNEVVQETKDNLMFKAESNYNYIVENYSVERIAQMQFELYKALLPFKK